MRAQHLIEPARSLLHALDRRQIARKWERFVAGQEVDLSDVPPFTREAWVRSKKAGIDPAISRAPWEELPSDPEILRAEIEWLSCAEPVLALLQSILTEPHQLFGVTDHRCRILYTQGGPKAKAKAEEIRAIPGGKFREEDIGANAGGTVLHTGIPLQLTRQEHYCVNWQNWIAQGAPIHDPTTNEILGVVFSAGYQEFSNPRALELVIRAAAMIETGVREQETRARLSVLERFTQLTIRYPSEGLLAIDKRGYLLAVNPPAEKMLLPYSQLIGRRVQDLPLLREQLGQLATARPTEPPFLQERLPGATIFPVSAERAAGAVLLLPQLSRPVPKTSSQQSWTATYTFADLVGHSPHFRECLDLAYQASQHTWPVLLLGESGTGKELLAHAIHNASPRRQGPFVVFNCAGVSDDLIGTELFGYAEGTFTGALKGGKAGKVQLAHQGTLFLDDVDSMPLKMQATVLRVLEDSQVVPLGGQKPQWVDIRVIAAANCDLEQAVQEGRFRHDLYHRLHVLPVRVPPLRERVEDIALLAKHFLSRHAPSVSLTEEALELLAGYAWPGNVRELRNVLIAAAARAPQGLLTPSVLPLMLARSPSPVAAAPPSSLRLLKDSETKLIARTLQQTQSVPQAASLLGLHYSTLYRKLKKYGIDLPSNCKKGHP